jgi:hypothetical protein
MRRVCLGLVVGLIVRSAYAQDAAAAGAQFDRGLAEMQGGRYATGCPALDESYRLDPRPGTLFTLAECEAKWGHIASAVTHYGDYLAHYEQMPADQQLRQQEREKIARKQLAELKPQLPLLTVHVDEVPPGTVVTKDGHELGQASLEVPLPVDPGDHVIGLLTPSGGKREEKVSIGRGERKVVDIEGPAAEPVPPPERPVAGSHKGWTIAAFTVAGASLAVGAVTGSMVFSMKSDIDTNCVGTVCNATGKSAADSGQTLAAISTAMFIVSGATLVTAIVLLVTEPKHPRATSALAVAPLPGGASVGWSATW